MRKIVFFLAVPLCLILSSFSGQLLKTNLKITVRNDLGNLEEGVSVQLFSSEEDYREEKDPVTEILLTDDKGVVKFKDLEPKVYFVNAEKDDKNNIGAGVATQKLDEGKTNKVTIIIE